MLKTYSKRSNKYQPKSIKLKQIKYREGLKGHSIKFN